MTLAERNEWFNALSVNEKRVEIAKDVIAQLDAHKYRAQQGAYIYVSGKADEDVIDQCVIEEAGSCRVCAMGAVLASRIRLGNESHAEQRWMGSSFIVDALDGVFESAELGLMEFIFEGTPYNYIGDLSAAQKQSIYDYYYATIGEVYNPDNEEVRLRAIMNSIIKNEGKFILEDIVKSDEQNN